jgi:hypothetical protein
VRIESATEEILVGDRMLPAPRETLVNYVPHAPDRPIDARILRVPYGGSNPRAGASSRSIGEPPTASKSATSSRCIAAQRLSRIRGRRASRRSSCASSTRRRRSRRG